MPEGTPPPQALQPGMWEPLAPQRHRPLQFSKAHSDLASLRNELSKKWHSGPRNTLSRSRASWCPTAESCLLKQALPGALATALARWKCPPACLPCLLPLGMGKEGSPCLSACVAPLPAKVQVSIIRGKRKCCD